MYDIEGSDTLVSASQILPFNSFSEIFLFDFNYNGTVLDNYSKAYHIINNPNYKTIICSISGGSDSDIMLDIVYRCDRSGKVRYIIFDTGLEYEATKEHLVFLERKYNITIERFRGVPIPLTTRKYGVPFLNKQVSEFISRLQLHDFKFEDKPYEELILEYPSCQSALEWWCNKKKSPRLNISWNRYLKEFLVANPPYFKISRKCCVYSKEKPAEKLRSILKADLMILGLRKAEGGVRSISFHSCFSESTRNKGASYRPIFWYKNTDKEDYEKGFGVVHSRCYTEYKLPRTGCACCPFGQNFEYELEIARKYEPNLYTAAVNIFGQSYEYTRKYRDFVEKMRTRYDN